MFKRPDLSPLFVSLLLVACGPDAQELPLQGVYHFEAVTLENNCNPKLNDASSGDDVIEVSDDRINVPATDYLSVSEECEECVALQAYAQQSAVREPDTGVYASEHDVWFESKGCEHRKVFELDLTGSDSLTALLTDEWRDAGGCAWAGTGCTVTREYSYTLKEACDDCEFPLHASE